MYDTKHYFMMALAPLVFLILGYCVYLNYFIIDTDDARVTAEVVQIKSHVSGVIDKVMVTERQQVKSGETLAQFDNRSFEQAINTAETELINAEARFKEAEESQNQAKGLAKRNAITTEKLSEIRNNYNKTEAITKFAKEKVEQAKINLANTKIVAPQDDTIQKKYTEDGALVSSGQQLFGLAISSSRWVVGNFTEAQVKDIQVGTPATVKLDGIIRKSYDGEVESVIRRNTPVFAKFPPEASGVDLKKNTERTIVKILLLNLTDEDKNKLQDGLHATISINGR